MALGDVLAEAFVSIKPDFDAAAFKQAVNQGMAPVGAEAQRSIAQSFTQTGQSMQKVGRGMTTALTLPILGAGAAVLKMGGDFQQGMNQVSALSGATGTQFAGLESQAKELGATTQFSASQAADAMGFLAMAGFDADQILGAMPSTLQLASAAQMDLGRAADITSNILTGYGMEVSDLGHANDVLVKAFTSANMDLDQLGQAFKYVGPVAKSAGVEFETAAAAIGLMGNAGIQGSMAGTSLRGAITKLLTPSKEAAKTMDALGISAVDSTGNLLPLDQIVRQLETSGATTADMMTIFGQRAGPAMSALVGQGADALVALEGELRDSGGTAERISDVQMEGFNGAMREMRSAIEAAAIAFAQSGVLDMFTGLAAGVANVFQSLAATNPAILKLIAIFAGVLAVIGPVVLIAGKFAIAIGALIPVFAKLLPVVTKFGAFLLGWPAIIALIVAAFYLLYTRVDWFREAVDGAVRWLADNVLPALVAAFQAVAAFVTGTVLPALMQFAGWITGTVVPALMRLGQWLADNILPVLQAFGAFIIGTVVPALVAIGQWITGTVVPALAAFAGYVTGTIIPAIVQFAGYLVGQLGNAIEWIIGLWPLFLDAAQTVWAVLSVVIQTALGVIVAVVTAGFAAVQAVIQAAMTIVQVVITTAVGIITTLWRAFGDDIVAIVQIAWAFLGGIIQAAMTIIRGIITTVLAIIAGDWSAMWSGLGTILQGVWQAIYTIVSTAIALVWQTIQIGLSAIVAAWQIGWQLLVAALQIAWALIQAAVAVGWAAIQALFAVAIGALQLAWAALWAYITTAASVAWAAITAVISAAWNALVAFLQAGWAFLQAAWDVVWNAILAVLTAVWDAIVAAVTLYWNLLQAYVEAGLAFLQALWDLVWNAILAVAEFIWTAIYNAVVFYWNALQALVEAGLAFLQALWNAVWSAIQAVLEAVWNAIRSAVDAAMSFVRSVIDSGLNTIKSLWDSAWETVKSVLNAAWEAIKTAVSTGIDTIVGWFGALGSRISGAVGDLSGLLSAAGRAVIDGFKDAAEAAWNRAAEFFGGIKDKIANLKGPLPVDAVLLTPHGEAIIGGLMDGVERQLPAFYKQVEGIAPRVQASFGIDSTALPAGAGLRSIPFPGDGRHVAPAAAGPAVVIEHLSVTVQGGADDPEAVGVGIAAGLRNELERRRLVTAVRNNTR